MTVFHVKFSPQRRNDHLDLAKCGGALSFNGEVIDPSAYDESALASQWIVGRPEPTADGWTVTIILPHGSPAPRATRFPAPIVVSADGPVELPLYEGPDEDEAELLSEVADRLSKRAKQKTTAGYKINIPKRLTMAEMPDGVYFSEIASPFHEVPVFGAVVAGIIGTASLLELDMLRPAVSQHGSEALHTMKTAFAAFGRDHGKRLKYIRYVSENTGRERVWKTIEWAYEYSKPVFDIRNDFAHHIWGVCPALPNTLLLADPMDRLTGQAASSQLLGHHATDMETQILLRIATGEGGSKLSEADAKDIFEMVMARQNDPARAEAFNMTFNNPLDFRAPAAEIWTAEDFQNAALAANMARIHVVPRLQQISQWLNGQRAEDELEPLPATNKKKRKR